MTGSNNPLTSRSGSFKNLDILPDHWSNFRSEALISFSNQDLDLITVGGGAEDGEFCYVEDARNEDEGITYYTDNTLSAGDILLKVR